MITVLPITLLVSQLLVRVVSQYQPPQLINADRMLLNGVMAYA